MIYDRKENYEYARKELIKNIDKPLSHELIKKINSLVRGMDVQYRKGFGAPPLRKDGKKVYLPPDSELKDISQEIGKLVDWYNDNLSIVSPEILAARFHWGFVKIHPFDDGNGRTARLLSTYILLMHGYNEARLHNIEKYFEENKLEYYTMLDDEVKIYTRFDKCCSRWEYYFLETVKKF